MNTLIAYYSWHGNTRKIAEMIADETGGDLFEIKPKVPYTTDYSQCVKQVKEEIYAGFRPENDSYNTIFIGTPIWWYTMAPPVATFLESFDTAGKTVIPFHTHGGGGTFEKDVAALCPDAVMKRGISIVNSGDGRTAEEIRKWLK